MAVIAAAVVCAPAALAVVLGSLLFIAHALQHFHSGSPLLPR